MGKVIAYLIHAISQFSRLVIAPRSDGGNLQEYTPGAPLTKKYSTLSVNTLTLNLLQADMQLLLSIWMCVNELGKLQTKREETGNCIHALLLYLLACIEDILKKYDK